MSKKPYDFRSGLGTGNALYDASKFMYNALDNNKKVTAFFLDPAKAFDIVNYQEVINILSEIGLKNNWKQIVIINEITVEEMTIKCEVLQGSIMGSLLFILYINSIYDMKINDQIVTYADDTCLLFSGVSWEKVRLKATQDFQKVINYLNYRNRSINYKKNKLYTFFN